MATSAFGLLLSGAHGWYPAMLQPLLLLVAGGISVASIAGSDRRSQLLGSVLLILGVIGRQLLSTDLVAVLGLAGAHALVRQPTICRGLLGLMILCLVLTTRVGYYAEVGLAQWISMVAAIGSGADVSLGPVYSGARMAVVLITIVAIAAPTARGRQVGRILLLLAAAVAGAVLVSWAASVLPPFGSSPSASLRSSVVAAQLPWVHSVCGLAIVTALAARARPRPNPHPSPRFVAALPVLAAGALLLSLPPVGLPAARHVTFYRPGFSNWDLPRADLSGAGPYSTGMLGSLPMFARALGLRSDLVDDIDAEVLATTQILVLVNQNEPMTGGSDVAIEAWVRAGGHLVVVTDHTFLHPSEDGHRIHGNDPIAATGIRIENNSADHLTAANFDGTVAFGFAQPLDCVPGNPHMPIIGAGLALRWPATPLVIGRYGYEDLGRIPTAVSDDAIGDLTWNPGEHLGGVVLIAAQQLGHGRVSVVGDTTGFHNIARTSTWRVVGDFLLGRAHGGPGPAAVAAAVLLLLGIVIWRRRGPTQRTAMLMATALTGVAVLSNASNAPVVATDPAQPLLVLDTAVSPSGPRGDWSPEGHLTVISTALRSGFLPLFTNTKDGIPDGTRCIILSQPRADPGREWAANLLRWVEAGGHLLIAAGYEEQAAMAGLFSRIHCRVDPLVVAPNIVNVRDRVGEVVDVRLPESWNLSLGEGGWSRVLFDAETTTMAQRQLGEGLVTVVTDATFFQNRYQESEELIVEGNLRFTMSLLTNGVELR